MEKKNEEFASLTEEQKQHIRKAFDLIDLNHNGLISKYELTKAARVLGYNPTLHEAQLMIDQVDANGNGQIDFHEFAKMMADMFGALEYQRAQIDDAFRHLDKDGNGWISYKELKTALTQRGEKMSEEEFDKVVDKLDANKDGKIYYEDLAREMCKPVEEF